MDPRFNDIYTTPENEIFKVVFFPDRIYHAQEMTATRSPRYRYYIHEVRAKHDISALRGRVYLDGEYLTNFLRIEYRAGRLIERIRENNRVLRDRLIAWLKLHTPDPDLAPDALVQLHYNRAVDAYCAEIWQTLESPSNRSHDITVQNLMGYRAPITRVPSFSPALQSLKTIQRIELAFREHGWDLPFGYKIDRPEWDNNYLRSYQVPNSPDPNVPQNTVSTENYLIDFQRGWFLQADEVEPVRYRNAMMNEDDPERSPDNVIEMRWLLQREFGGTVVFFHEVTIPPGTVEGTHRHIGSEELYYITEGTGIAYMGVGDNPELETDGLPTVERQLYGLEKRPCREVSVRPGSVIYTKSGGIHGIRNVSDDEPLKFVAFLYHSR